MPAGAVEPLRAASAVRPRGWRRTIWRGTLVLAGAVLLVWLLFPWRMRWGDAVLIDRGPLHRASRFAIEFGGVAFRDGEQRRWCLPGIPGRGCLLDCRDWPAAFGRAEAASIELVVEDGQERREFSIHWDTDFADPEVQQHWREVALLPRRERPVAVAVRVVRAVKNAQGPVLQLRGAEPPRD